MLVTERYNQPFEEQSPEKSPNPRSPKKSSSYNDLNDIDFGQHIMVANKRRAAVANGAANYHSDSESDVSSILLPGTDILGVGGGEGLTVSNGSVGRRGRARSSSESEVGSECEPSSPLPTKGDAASREQQFHLSSPSGLLDISISPLDRPRGTGSLESSPLPFTLGNGVEDMDNFCEDDDDGEVDDDDDDDDDVDDSMGPIGNPMDEGWKEDLKQSIKGRLQVTFKTYAKRRICSLSIF